MSAQKRMLRHAEKRILPVVSSLAILLTTGALGAVVPASAEPPANGEYTYKISEFTQENVQNGVSQSISGVPNLFSWTSQAKNKKYFYLVSDAPGYTGQVLHDGEGNRASGARETVIEPLVYTDGGYSFPVTELSGKRTLTFNTINSAASNGITKSSSVFYTHKKTENMGDGTVKETYTGAAFALGAGTQGLLVFRSSSSGNSLSTTLTRDAEGNVINSEYSGGANQSALFYNNTSGNKLQDYLIDEDGNKLSDDEKAAAAEVFKNKTTLTDEEKWVGYRMFVLNEKVYIDMTMELDVEGEKQAFIFRFDMQYDPSKSDPAYKVNFALGGRYSGASAAFRYPNYYADFTVKYDVSGYVPEVDTGELDEKIAALAPYTLKNNPDLLAELAALKEEYDALDAGQKAEVANGETLTKAFEALSSGSYFYDSLSDSGNWKIGETAAGYSYYETKDVLPDGAQMVSVKGQIYLPEEGNNFMDGPLYQYKAAGNWFWVGLKVNTSDKVNPVKFHTAGCNGGKVYMDDSKKAKPENYIEGSDNVTFKRGTWVDFSYTYDFEKEGCYIYTLTGVDNEGNPAQIVYRTPEAAKLFDNAKLVVRTDRLAELYRDVSITLLDSNYAEGLISSLPDPNNVTLEDENAINTVRSIVENQLSDEERGKISAEAMERLNSIIEALEDAIAGIELDPNVTITFEEGQPGQEYFEAVRASTTGGWGVVTNPYKVAGNTSANVLKITQNYAAPDGDSSTGYAIYKLKDKVVPGNKALANFSGKLYMENGGSGIVVFDYKSADQWAGFRIYRSGGNKMVFQEYYKKQAGENVNKTKTYETTFGLENAGGYTMSGNVWADFDIEYSLLDCTISIRVYDKEGGVYLGGYDRVYTLYDTCETQVGFAVSNATKPAYVDDVFVNFQDSQAYTEAQNFLSAHEYILNLIPAETYLSYNDFEAVDLVVEAYGRLTEGAKKCIPFTDTRIENLKAAKAAYEAAPDFEEKKARDLERKAQKDAVEDEYDDYTLTEDFESGDLSLFQPAKKAINTGGVSIVDDAYFGSRALRLEGRSVLTIKELLLPDRPQVAQVSYKIYVEKLDDSNKRGTFIGYNYHENYTYRAYNFYQTTKALTASYNKYTPPATTSYATPTDLVAGPGEIWNVSLSYTARGSVSIQITDSNGATVSLTDSADLDALFVLASNDITAFIDDVTVTYRKGNYDVDVESEDINVNYTANTWVKPGDVAMVSGENLKNNVSRVEIMALANNAAAAKGFIDRTWFDFEGVQEGEFSAAPAEPVWNQEDAQPVEIVQWTLNSLKFVVPDDLPNGIYAVKLYSSRSSEDDEIIYINAPSIDYTVGSDGAITAPGSTMRVIGKNLGYDMDALKLKAVMVSADGKATRELTVSAVQSNYSISVDIPADAAYGEYELWVYGGYGDGTAWTIPYTFTVGAAVRDGWDKTVFNVRDYGANGNSDQNATPFLVNALAAIAENGGGILYLPAGQYDITAGLVIPENCVVTGDGPDKTTINFRPYTYAIGKMPTALLSFTKNVEISNLAIKGQRVSGVFRGYGDSSDNLYFENLYVTITPYAGTVTEGTGGTYSGLVSSSELYGMVSMESVNPVLSIQNKGDNVQIRNFDASRTLGRNRPIVNDKNGSYYWQVDNIKTTGEWSEVVISTSLWENSDHGPNSCLGVWGHGLYFANNNLHDRTDNNKELYVADRNAPYRDQITPLSDAADNTQYYLVKALNKAAFSHEDMQVYIVDGQGVGQTRQIVKYEEIKGDDGTTKYLVTLNRPFNVAPNRNSTVVIRRPRENIFFVGNEYSNGGSGGFYGGVADVVYDSNTWNNCTSIYQMGIFYDVNWYLSIVGDTVNQGPNGTRGYDWRAQSGKNAQMGFLLRGCTINGQVNTIKPGSTDSMVDVIIDKNTWSGSAYAISFDAYASDGRYEGIDGFLMARNMLEDTPFLFESNTVPDAAMRTTNAATSKRLVMLELPVDEGDSLIGDVNRDGKVSLKDATLILFAVVGRVELTDSQKEVADVNGDGTVSTKDATMICMYLIGDITELKSPI